MSDEIQAYVRLDCINGAYRDNFRPISLKFDQTNQGADSGIMLAPSSSSVAVDNDGLTTPGFLALLNLSSSSDGQYVSWGPGSTGNALIPLGRLNPGEPALLRADPTVSIRLQACSTGAQSINVQYLWLED